MIEIENQVKEILKIENVKVIKRLYGGKSNYTYVVQVDDVAITFRIPGKNGNNFVNREIEQKNLAKIEKLKINNRTIFFNKQNGQKISQYVYGSNLGEYPVPSKLDEIVSLIKKVHNLNNNFDNNYEPFLRLAKYHQLAKAEGAELNPKYYPLEAKILKYQAFLENYPLCPCHNDLQPSNFIITENNELMLTDWEFSGNNDWHYDIASYAGFEIKNSEQLLEKYLNNPNQTNYKRIYLWRIFQCLQWANVAAYKAKIGLSEEFEIDFLQLSDKYINYAEKLFEKITLVSDD